MTVVLNGKKSIHLGAQAHIVEDAKEIASSNWASRAMVNNDAYKWILGRFVEADNPNRNGQMWSHADLVMSQPTIQYAPMNVLHQSRNIVGAFIDTEMVYPQGDQAQVTNAYIEALGVFWKGVHPETYSVIQAAHQEGKLFYSMECVAEQIQFTDKDGSQSDIMDYAGVISESYGEWNNRGPEVTRQLIKPHFIGGALIIPPVNPGWANAEVTDLAGLMDEYSDELDQVYQDLASEHPHLDANEVERITLELLRRNSESDSLEYSISEETNPKTVVFDDTVEHIGKNNLSEGGDMTTYSQEQVEAMIAEAVAPLQDELSNYKAKADAEAVEAQIQTAREQFETEVAEIRAQLDAKVLETEAAEAKYNELVAMLEEAAEAEAKAAERAERMDARLAKIGEVANFPEEYVAANADRWADMSDEAFESLLEDYTAVAMSKGKKKKDDDKKDDEIPDKSALQSGDRETASHNTSKKASLSSLRHVDFATL